MKLMSVRGRAGTVLYLTAVVALVAAWVRSAWLMPLRNYAFDFSINYTGSRLIEPFGADRPLYDRLTLALEAAPYTFYPALYTKLYLTYIQTPITAVVTLPVSRLSYDHARFTFLAANNLLLVAAAALMLWTLRPSRLLVLGSLLIFATYEAMFDSLRLGNVDGLITFSLAAAFALLRRGPRWAAGAPLALAAVLKLSPAILVGYLAWRRAWGAVAVAAGSAVTLIALSVLVAGWDNNVTFVREMMPKLLKGSTFYDNISLGGAVARAWLGREYWLFEDELPALPLLLRLALPAVHLALVLGAFLVAGEDEEAGFMLTVATAILISPVAWSFYPTWLIPSLLWLIRRYEDRRAWRSLALLALLYPALAIVPAHFRQISDDLLGYPLKTAALAAYIALLALEARAGVAAARRQGRAVGGRPAAAGASR